MWIVYDYHPGDVEVDGVLCELFDTEEAATQYVIGSCTDITLREPEPWTSPEGNTGKVYKLDDQWIVVEHQQGTEL